MHLATDNDSRPIESTDELRAYFEDGCKPRERWLLGTEFELIPVRLGDDDLGSAPGHDDRDGIRSFFHWMSSKQGWTPVQENDYAIALTRGNSQISFEPGGQFELAAKPVTHADQLADMHRRLMKQLAPPSECYKLAWLGIGFRPFGGRDDVPWMPKERYVIMREYMPTVGTLGIDMMKRTGTVQVNLDFSDERDAREKMRAVMSVTSLMTALYASSPIVDGQDSGYQSYRAHIWTDTDNARCGLLDFVFDTDDVFSAYGEWALDVPMYFVFRDGYQRAGGMTFRQFLQNGWQGHRATMEDWALHLSTLFPEGRLKKLIEVRGCDCGSPAMILALGPLCRGLLYDADARAAATALTASLTVAERHQLQEDVARHGLRARAGGHLVHDLARELMTIARTGLERQTPSEVPYLDPLLAIAESGRTQADEIRELWQETGGDMRALVEHSAHYCPGVTPLSPDDVPCEEL